MTYKEVVKKAKTTLQRRGHYGTDDVDLYACDLWLKSDQINLWTYWQGFQIDHIDKGIDIMLVGQDWGNPDWDKVVLVPIKSDVSPSGYTKIYNEFELTSTKLVGGETPIHISIVYGHFNK